MSTTTTDAREAVNRSHLTLPSIDNVTRIDDIVDRLHFFPFFRCLRPGRAGDIPRHRTGTRVLHACLGYLWRDTRSRLKARCCVWISTGPGCHKVPCGELYSASRVVRVLVLGLWCRGMSMRLLGRLRREDEARPSSGSLGIFRYLGDILAVL